MFSLLPSLQCPHANSLQCLFHLNGFHFVIVTWRAARIIEILLEGIRVQFRDNEGLVTLNIWTAIAFVETPRHLPFQWNERERLQEHQILCFPFFLFKSHSLFFSRLTDPLSRKRGGMGNETFYWDGLIVKIGLARLCWENRKKVLQNGKESVQIVLKFSEKCPKCRIVLKSCSKELALRCLEINGEVNT